MEEACPVTMTVKEWAEQEKPLIDQFAKECTEKYGEDAKFHPGDLDDMFGFWHEDFGQALPEDT